MMVVSYTIQFEFNDLVNHGFKSYLKFCMLLILDFNFGADMTIHSQKGKLIRTQQTMRNKSLRKTIVSSIILCFRYRWEIQFSCYHRHDLAINYGVNEVALMICKQIKFDFIVLVGRPSFLNS